MKVKIISVSEQSAWHGAAEGAIVEVESLESTQMFTPGTFLRGTCVEAAVGLPGEKMLLPKGDYICVGGVATEEVK